MLIEEVFAALRGGTSVPDAAPAPVGKAWIEAVTGRYLHTDLCGRPHRIYFEEAGPANGIPLLCLHTAGSDGRQYRAILNDPEVTRAYRVISFDLPWHGKSSPPAGFEKEVYRLTTDLYVETVMNVARALGLDRPVVMGCSIGGRAVLHLALRHGAAFRAAIGLQSALYADPGANPALRELELTHRPDAHGGDVSAAFVACLISPTSPTCDRWETLWHYSQGGPGVFMGDLVYYMADGDMRNLDLAPLKAQQCPLYLLTGEYDLSATPALTADLAKQVNATHFEVMPGLGHFPMSEAPERFLKHLRPLLRRIEAAV
ncbi:MAG: alpha/beta hydrolase [Alphaproteobacteria bacterium]|nr:alpha/beta hydrolase [Alphaproteobacteria bacterium]